MGGAGFEDAEKVKLWIVLGLGGVMWVRYTRLASSTLVFPLIGFLQIIVYVVASTETDVTMLSST